MEQDELKYNRDYCGSLYAIGYTDGYKKSEHIPRYRTNQENTDLEICVALDDETAEYNAGFEAGKFNFIIDTKINYKGSD